jgi:3-carboxy-cis,cis-muconate cycloisomerase
MTDILFSTALLGPLFSSAAMRTVVDDRARLQRMLDFEAELARAEAAVGVIPANAIRAIGEACQAELYDLAALAQAATPVGNVVIPLVEALTAEVEKRNETSARYVHWGASSQDVIDTTLVLELRAAIDVLLNDLDRATKAFTALAGRHRRTMTVARTLLQQAIPMPFGVKIAGYAAALARSRERLRRVRKEALALQFGGGGGTLAALGDKGLDVSERLAALLDLPQPDAPWHSFRDRLAEVASVFAILAGTCGKIARDVGLLMQSEVGEAFEPAVPGGGGASTLPHKRNPVASTAALSAASIAPSLAAAVLNAQIQEHERGLGSWQSEWATFPALALVTSGALQAVVDIAEGLEVDVDRMKANLEASGGQVFAEAACFALAEKIGRPDALRLVQELTRKAAAEKRPLQEVLAADQRASAHLDTVELERLFVPTRYQGSAQTFIDRLVASAQGRQLRRPPEIKSRPAGSRSVSAAATVAAPTMPAPDLAPPATPAETAAEPIDPAATPLPSAEAPPLPSAEAPPLPPAAEEQSALVEAFARVTEAAEQMASKPQADRGRKPV